VLGGIGGEVIKIPKPPNSFAPSASASAAGARSNHENNNSQAERGIARSQYARLQIGTNNNCDLRVTI